MGGIANALANHADEVAASPEKACGTALEQCFRALAEFDRDGRAVRRAFPFRQLLDEAGVSEADLRAVVGRFHQDDCSFLAPPPSVPLADDTIVDIGHEALIRNWARLSGGPAAGPVTAERTDWLAAEARDGQTYRVLLGTAERSAKVVLSRDQMLDLSRWWEERKRTEAWAKRYGGGWKKADDLLVRSRGRNRMNMAVGGGLLGGLSALVLFLIVLAAVTFQQVRRERDNAVATTYWSRFAFSDDDALSRDEVAAAWDLSDATSAVKAAFVAEVAKSGGNLMRPAASPHVSVVLRAMGLRAAPSLRDAPVEAAQRQLRHMTNPENVGLPGQVIAAVAPDLSASRADDVIAWLESFLIPPSGAGIDEHVPEALSALAGQATEARGLEAFRKVLEAQGAGGRPGAGPKMDQLFESYARFGEPPSWHGPRPGQATCSRFQAVSA